MDRAALFDAFESRIEAALWVQDLDPLRTIHASRAYEAIWGRSLDALYGNPRDWIEAVHPEDRPRVETAYERLLGGEPFDQRYRILRPDGQVRWIRDRGSPLRTAQGIATRVAGIAEDVTENVRTERALRLMSSRAAEDAEARERRALARDLHDVVSQSLSLARTKLAALRDASGGSDTAARLREIESLIADAEEGTRTLTFRLSPPTLHDVGLPAAAQWLAEDLERRFGLHVVVIDDELPKPLSAEAREALFRSLRELLINVARHARTDKASVRLMREGEALAVTVEDGGTGFDREASSGFGLASVRERVEGLGGRIEIESESHRGTRIRMVAPLSATA